jgi:excisionase family DNA binding protein
MAVSGAKHPEAARKERPMSKVLWSPQELAGVLGMDVKTIRAAIGRGEIPSTKFGRLIKVPGWWVEQQRHGPGQAHTPEAA